MRGTKIGEEVKRTKIIILIFSVVGILIILGAIIGSGALQQKLTLNSKIINSKTNLDKANSSSTGIESSGGIVTTVNGGGSGGGSSGGGGGGGSSASALSGGVILAAGDPSFSNYWDNSGILIGSGIARFNVSIVGSNGSDGISIGGKNYSIDNNNWLDFDGVGDYVNYGNNAQFSPIKTGVISFYAFVTPTTTKTMSVISKDKDTPVFNHEYDLQFDAEGNIAFYVYQRSGGTYCTIAAGPVNGDASYVAGRTYFVYAEYINDTSCSLQVDGGDLLTSTNIDRTYPAVSGVANLKIGQRDSGIQDFQGSVDNFVFYNTSLNPIQVQRIYNEKNLGKSVPVLSYHRIYNYQTYLPHPDQQEIVNKTNFAAQMKFLHDNGYQTITYKQWDNWTKGIGTIPEKPIIIGFDDGWYNTYLNAKPIMDSYGYVGVVAVIGATLEGAPGSGEEEGAMNFAQLQVLSNNGWEIASHSYTHPVTGLVNETTEERIFEFNDSKNLIQKNLHINVTTFIYPFDLYNIVTDGECGKYYSICSGYSAYPEHAGIEGDEDFFIFKSTNKVYSDGSPIGMRRVAITNYTTLNDFKYYVDYSNNQQINSQFDESSGSIASDSSGNGNNGAITGATWDNNLFHKELFLNNGVYNYYWWAYDGLGGYDVSDIRSYTVYPPYVPNISLQITSPTTANPINAASGSDVSIYFNFLNMSYVSGQWLPKNVTSGVVINNVVIGGKIATIRPSPSVNTSNTYSATNINTLLTDSRLNQPPAWNDGWDRANASQSCYTDTLTSNNVYCVLSVSGGFFVRDRDPWARFNFTIPENVNTITSIQITAEGYASTSSAQEDLAFIIADFTTRSWEKFGADTKNETTRTVLFTSGFSDYIQNGQLVLLLEGLDLDDGESIGIDYVAVTVNATTSSGGKQFVYIPNMGWQVNVTAPNATDGLQNLFVNATWASYYGYVRSDTQADAIDYRTDKINPDIQIIYPLNNTNWSINTLDVNYTVNDTNLISCWYTNGNISINNSIACGQNITAVVWSEGLHNVTIWAKDLSNNVNSSSVNFRIDTTPPSFINLTNQIMYDNQSLNYDINATDSGVGFGSFAINWTKIFGIVPATGVLTNISNLTAGNYYINVSVNDTLGNLNSAILFVNISSAADKVPPYFTAIPPAANINYAQILGVDFNASDERVFGTYAINSTLFMINASGWLTNSSPTIAVGNYYINVTINDTANNLNSTIYFVNVSKATTILNLTAISPITYPTPTNFTGTGCPSQLNCSLNKANAVYGVGTVTFNYSTAGNSNYTPASAVFTVVISQNSSYILGITGTSPITYGISTDVAGSGCPSQLNCSLNKANAIYGVGTVTFNYSTAGNSNYTSRSVAKDIVINKATLNFAVTLTSPINYPVASNYIGRITNGEASCSPVLYRTAVHLGTGAVSIGNGFAINDTTVLGVGTYMYNYTTSGCVNYTDSENIKTLFVNLVNCYSNAECDDSNSHTQDICNNPGTPQSSCSHSAIVCLANSECDDSNPRTQDICNNPGTNISSCSNLAITCLSDSECGTNVYLNVPICQSENVWQDFKTYTCSNPGTSSSSCSDSTSLKLKETCAGGCTEGRCKVKSCETVCNYGTCHEYCVWE